MVFISDIVRQMPVYLFSQIQRKKAQLEKQGVDVIDLGIGAPDLPTPEFICDVLDKEARIAANQRYSNYQGIAEYRKAVADFYMKHYGVEVDPETEVIALIGSKEGIAHLIQAVLNPGDKVLLPDPGYPVYQSSVHIAGGEGVLYTLSSEFEYKPDFKQISDVTAKSAKLMLLNYPNNPTSATVELETFKEAVDFARKHNLVVANDAAYSLVTFKGYKAPSILQVPGAKDYAVEIGSLSKSFNMAGWRIGYMAGNKEIIQAMLTLKSNVDSSQFIAIQKAAAAALKSDFRSVEANNEIYYERLQKLHHVLTELGLEVQEPKGTFFVWAKVPTGTSSQEFANKLLEEAGIIVTPGTAFGQGGEGYIRIALTVPVKRLDEVNNRLRKVMDKL